ncbi:MAG: hypothetical protein IIB19_07390, partial [Chloroflexi bacterium]|nr:hypothetical protein [Chloroflexota bacterium]
LGRRLNRISEEANELLQIAAVAGSEFTYDTLTLLEEHTEDDLLKLIEEALDARVIEEMDRPGRYRFTHAQMQETLLAELSTTRRVRLHGRIGEALEKRYGDRADEHPDALAGHFVEAAMLTPRHAEKAVRYSKLAATQAEEQAAWDVAARHYENCLTLVSEADDKLGEDEAGLLTELAQCWQKSAEFRQAWRCLTRAINLYRERGDGVGMARATLAARMQATPEQERAQREAALVSLADDDPHARAQLLVPERVDFSESAERDAARAAQLARTHEFADVDAKLLDRESHRALYERRFVDVLPAARTAFQAFDVLNDVTNAAHHLTDIAMVHLMSGDLDQADTAAIEGRDYARKSRLRLWEQWNIAILGACTLLRCQNDRFDALAREMPGRHEFMDMLAAARAERAGDMERALALAPTMDSVAAGGSVTLNQVVGIQGAYARVLSNAGDENAARSQLSAWGESFNGLDYILFAAPGLAEVDECLTVLGDDELVQSVYERAVQWESVRSGPYSSQGIDHILGALALRLDSVDEAEQHYRTGLEWCERERCPVEAGRCLQGLAEVAERRGNTAEALPLLDRAAALFQEHGAKLYLGRVIATKVKLQGITSGDIKTSIDAVAATVLANQPDLRQHAAPDGTVTILFSDIESHTAINERLGDQRWMELLREHNALVREQIQSHEGYEVKTEGDGFMVAFGSARKAVQCAIAMQRAFAKRNGDADESMLVRIGLHTGEPVKENNDFYGTQVTQAARIANEANGGQIL